MKFTFKTEHPTGRYRSFYPSYHHIKLKKIEVGSIDDREPHSIRLMIVKSDEDKKIEPNCEWKWVTLRAKFTSISEAKEFLNKNFEEINKRWDIYIDKP